MSGGGLESERLDGGGGQRGCKSRSGKKISSRLVLCAYLAKRGGVMETISAGHGRALTGVLCSVRRILVGKSGSVARPSGRCVDALFVECFAAPDVSW